ncbi:MAG: hypothetical protein H6741_32420, partial [Alphaproteobacteria bacterium]|nr:hypothetical protein [Alphaproteobacteria bacterium]
PDGQAALLMSCKYELWTGVVDDYSWAGWESYIRDHFFGDLTVAPADKIQVSPDGRDGFLYALPDNGDRAIRMAVAPYDQGHVLTYAIGRAGDTGTLDGAIRASMVSTEFTDEGGGAHPVGAYQWIDYYWNYRRSSPVVWGPAVLLLGLIGLIVVKVRGGSKPAWDDDEV